MIISDEAATRHAFALTFNHIGNNFTQIVYDKIFFTRRKKWVRIKITN